LPQASAWSADGHARPALATQAKPGFGDPTGLSRLFAERDPDARGYPGRSLRTKFQIEATFGEWFESNHRLKGKQQ
jgi:hypothetical protein